MSKSRFQFNRKPRQCPSCVSLRVATILYGMIEYTPDLGKELDEGKIILGGCCVSMDDPAWACADCEVRIYKIS